MLGPIISVLFIAVVARLLLRKYNPQAVLLLSGLAMLLAAAALKMPLPDLQQPTGVSGFDFFASIKESFSKTNAGVGLMIMAIGGFVAYMDKIGASDILVHLSMRPLQLFKKNPYLAASMVIPIAQVLFIAIPSAAGLSLLLMASLFPILLRLGVSRLSAVSVITASTAFGIGPACATTASAIEIMDMDTVFYFLHHQIPLVWPLSIVMMVAYYFTNRYYDQKNRTKTEEVPSTEIAKPSVPAIYALLPILPIVLLLVFSEIFSFFETPIYLDTTTVMFISLFVALLFEAIRHRQLKTLLASLQVFWNGMGDIFKSVVTLIITADIFAKGLISLGFIDGLISSTSSLGFSMTGIGIAMTIMIFLAAMLMGSGNAAFFAFGPLVPKIAGQLSMETTTLLLPMQLAASMGRTVSPVSGVLIATAEIAKVSSMDIVKRNLIPLSAALLVMLVYHFI
jgi:C4-dicarboxylate transporter, DcuC family